MYKRALILLVASFAPGAVGVEASILHARKHHKKHHKKHGHSHHHSHKHAKKPEEWEASNHTNVFKIPPTAEETAAVDAINAHNSANTAHDAAKVAAKVAVHSVDINNHARSALKKAQDVLAGARAGAGSLSVQQQELLKRAETNLAAATDQTVIYNAGAVKYVSANAGGAYKNDAAERTFLEHRLQNLDGKLVHNQPLEVLRSENELAAMEIEIRQLRMELEKKDAAVRREVEYVSTVRQLTELETMVRELEMAEATHQVRVNQHDEMKIQLEKIREKIAILEVRSRQPDTGTLVYELPATNQLPMRTLESSSHAEAHAEEEDSGPNPGERQEVQEEEGSEQGTPVSDSGIDIDTAMPYGELEPFGREDTAQELTEDSVRESDEMVDQLERAEVAEEKRAVFRALTRLRGAAITSFDGIARSQTGNIDEYNKLHKWRRTHPLHHLADEESDISKWAFPDNADF